MRRKQPAHPNFLALWLGSAKDGVDLLARWDEASRRTNLKGMTFIHSMPGETTFLPGRIDLAGGRATFHSLLAGEQITFLNRDIRRRMRFGVVHFPLDHTVSFDTQFIAYFSDLLRGRSHALEPHVHRVLTYATAKRMNWDVGVFYQENRERIAKRQETVYQRLNDNLYAAEFLKTLDEEHYLRTGELRSSLTDDELWNKVANRITYYETTREDNEWLGIFHELVYIVLLKVAQLEFTYRRDELEKKNSRSTRVLSRDLGHDDDARVCGRHALL
jgi:hypothetical protein